jgi:hypothetical protein
MGCADNYKDWRDTAPYFVTYRDECIPCQTIERANKVNTTLFKGDATILTLDQLLIKSK